MPFDNDQTVTVKLNELLHLYDVLSSHELALKAIQASSDNNLQTEIATMALQKDIAKEEIQ